MTTQQFRAFFTEAKVYLATPRFQAAEVDYKISFQGELRPAMAAYRSRARNRQRQLIAALHSPNQNMIDWRLVQPLIEWCSESQSNSDEALTTLWFSRANPDKRVARFSSALHDVGITQIGAQLSIASTLLMGVSATEHPPIRTRKFSEAFRKSGFPAFAPDQDAAARYAHSCRFLDLLISEAPTFGLRLRHRLEAQGVVWCIGGGWKRNPDSDEPHTDDDSLGDLEAARLIEEEARGRDLGETEKQALVLSRRGQGQFREDLIAHWGKCAVTGCRNLRLLRASHIKPWKESSNLERLDPFNGLLLAPQLDAALDCGLLTFDDDGKILLSSRLSPADGTSLSIRRGMRLSHVHPRHRQYLRFHRSNRFRR